MANVNLAHIIFVLFFRRSEYGTRVHDVDACFCADGRTVVPKGCFTLTLVQYSLRALS